MYYLINMEKMKRNGSGRRTTTIASALSGLQSILRLYFSYLGYTEGIDEFLTTPVPQGTLQFINVVFFILGVAGIVATLGLLLERKWGLWWAFMVTVLTVVFDTWGLKIQSTAAMGIVMPVLSMILIYMGRLRFARGGSL
jgi:hypothetical protein